MPTFACVKPAIAQSSTYRIITAPAEQRAHFRFLPIIRHSVIFIPSTRRVLYRRRQGIASLMISRTITSCRRSAGKIKGIDLGFYGNMLFFYSDPYRPVDCLIFAAVFFTRKTQFRFLLRPPMPLAARMSDENDISYASMISAIRWHRAVVNIINQTAVAKNTLLFFGIIKLQFQLIRDILK